MNVLATRNYREEDKRKPTYPKGKTNKRWAMGRIGTPYYTRGLLEPGLDMSMLDARDVQGREMGREMGRDGWERSRAEIYRDR